MVSFVEEIYISLVSFVEDNTLSMTIRTIENSKLKYCSFEQRKIVLFNIVEVKY
jgi:hypothetical protein